ncbi:class I SAM-dependent methyltransferase [Saccharophagus degradans]|uniref:Class I SAM-dependent methyltransferase n=1 Tax=Saccharophagus degradans TaxID=86304 RepID=A0AAW7XA21_9GAMM|nr:class I SAM-dependent methyltransferase [Saccharophagus degradans]MDO6424420.1 class I SAM-dependent methyltransferase [Saccharophagus degradans]MDO6608373.1 class I SAM-dependent methyltransferase [Saccharophagus degradans]
MRETALKQNTKTSFGESFSGGEPVQQCVTSPNWEALQLDAMLQGQLTETLRNRVSEISKPSQSETDVYTKAASVAEWLLTNNINSQAQKELLDQKLNELFLLKQNIYREAGIPNALTTRQFINASGLVMSPKDCMTTVRDTFRMFSFIRGMHEAVTEKLHCVEHKLQIAYPACGPFAPLLLPLLCHYKKSGIVQPEKLSVTFVDIQPGAVQSLQALVTNMGLENYVAAIVCDDATRYIPENKPDLVLLEAMQHGFSREAHFSIARHYAGLLNTDGVMIPKNISVGAMLNVAQREYVDQWRENPSLINSDVRQEFIAERTDLGEIFNLNISTILQTKTADKQEETELLECGEVLIPQLPHHNDEQVLMIYTRINTYGEEWLDEYQSGITHPLPDMQICINFVPKDPKPGDLLVNAGDTLKFYYCLNGLPGFLAIKK